jgi:hypothetical protein
MNYDSSTLRKAEALIRASERGNALSPSTGTSQGTSGKTTPARNWAWAHATDSYDWMDSVGPLSTSDLSD